MGDVGALIGDIFGTGRSPEQIYDDMTTGPGDPTVLAAKDAANNQASLHQEIVDLIAEQHADIATGWQGGAGDAARNAATPVTHVAQQATQQLTMSHDLLAMQSDVYNHTRNNVVPMPPNPGQPDFVSTAFPMLTDHAEQAAAYREAAETNKRVYEAYHGNTGKVGETMPTDYGTLLAAADGMDITLRSGTPGSADGQPVSGPPQPGGTYGGPPAGSATGTPTTGPSTTGTPTAGTSTGGPAVTGTPGAQLPAASGADDTTRSASYIPPGGTSGSLNGPGSTPYSPVGGNSGNSPAGTGFGPVGSYRAGMSSGSGPGGSADSAGSRGPGSSYGTGRGTAAGTPYGAGRPGSGVGAGGGSGNDAARGALGAGRGTGVGTTGGPGGPAAGGSSPAGGARGGAGGMLGGAPGRGQGKGGEDEEHERPSYLQERDPDGVFVGKLDRTTPPVIGQ
ncbi:PPE domain-containing protein [Qaidamihabitans albus]|uniref:PPE domain-containing protein n=1 Tax=Qaidamihabitans albus TaxID=2795733 RepID=UPI0018F226AE|nr:hypothetical protein [Qaidamihabitans albus]